MEKKQQEKEINYSFHQLLNWDRMNEFKQQNRSRRGLQRKVIFIIDMSLSMNQEDYQPNRITFIQTKLKEFFEEFYIDNPLSEIGLICTRNKTAEQQFPLSRNLIIQKEMKWGNCEGQMSLQISLDLAQQILSTTSNSSSREIIIVTSSITTCDPGNIYDTIETLKKTTIRCSVISFAPEMHITRLLTKVTGGDYHTIMNEKHAEDVLHTFIIPPIYKENAYEPKTIQLYIGFPKQLNVPTICECHSKIDINHFECPICGFCYCELPIQCKICNAILLLSHHFARSYHFMFPIEPFKVIAMIKPQEKCFGCGKEIDDRMEKKEEETVNVYQCKKCLKYYCNECDSFIHDVLYNCPGCESKELLN
ncbi:hypothetical protein ENUP19_0298G0102 [Entamoeba nuttalli]|uniref:TFIIH basal transcription factor complex subunit, putative n=3 Tax=Entamoeba nuttalli TaxID=412467 RepID=K2H884_ENTNP|nr:TFIIH basal transcription factor complex subunit, putative [Entamoeba nuttalli P19]EKE42827.1 TFIIH basal transcription factor complex subunit, putative [Entamoeba nuttalli P19]|eukprot:XP_008854840.1 TFIIH basal transcription factor complex subunit, putative [Entamoeba nuttalli P19]